MFGFLKAHLLAVSVAGLLIVFVLVMVVRLVTNDPLADLVTTTVERGRVAEIVSVSGVVDATQTAKLAFPQAGIVSSVEVQEGQSVEEGTLLAALSAGMLVADLRDAEAVRASALADREELISGPTTEAREVTDTSVAIKQANLERIRTEQNTKVDNARRTLLSSGVAAVTNNPSETAAAPTVSGTYRCTEEGEYTLDVYRTGTASGYSYELSGLESGTYPVSIDQPSQLGACGLRIQFNEEDSYSRTEWIIQVPNTEASTYTTNLNAYELALNAKDNALAAAIQELELARRQQTLENAAPRSEAIARANASIAQANARIERINAQLSDRTIRAPFAGTITDVSVLPGETVTTVPVITLLADEAFELTARIPEIDVTKITVGQRAEILFDARAAEIQKARIVFISPLAVEIDGVAYYEAKLELTEYPNWLRSGLNADVAIFVDETENVLRLPNRFVTEENGKYQVEVLNGNTIASSMVEVGLIGNDGFVEVRGLDEGAIILAP